MKSTSSGQRNAWLRLFVSLAAVLQSYNLVTGKFPLLPLTGIPHVAALKQLWSSQYPDRVKDALLSVGQDLSLQIFWKWHDVSHQGCGVWSPIWMTLHSFSGSITHFSHWCCFCCFCWEVFLETNIFLFSCFLSPCLVHSALLKENRHYDVSPAKHSKKSHETERQSKRKKRQRKRESEVKIV